MAQYAITFDLDTKAMRAAGMGQAQIVGVYQREIPRALANAGFTAHPQGSVYHTEVDRDQITALMVLQQTLRDQAPNFCNYVRSVHVFRMEDWSDVTAVIATKHVPALPDPEEEMFVNDLGAIDLPEPNPAVRLE